MEIKTIIVDDEPLARDRIEKLLLGFPFVQVNNKFSTGKEALDFIHHHSVDLVFLDIQMPEMNGIEFLKLLPLEKSPLIVFVTAYDKYAVEAFNHFAVDYLLKPFSNERFRQTVQRVLQRFMYQNTSKNSLLSQLIDYFKQNTQDVFEDKFKIELAGKIYFIEVSSIEYIRAEGNYLILWAGQKKHVIRQTLNNISQKVHAPQFIRIHRSTIINLEFLREVRRTPYSELEVKMQSGETFRVSRTYKTRFSKRLEI